MAPEETRSIIRACMRLAGENKMLTRQLESYKAQYDELYAAFVSFLMQNGREMRLKKENIVPLVLGDYRVEHTDEGGDEVVYRLRYLLDEH